MILHQNQKHLRVRLASPEQIRSWAERVLPNGEIVGCVTSNRTIHYKSYRAERDGLFCERIFGPMKSDMCGCPKRRSKSISSDENTPLYCEQCGVEFTTRQVRRHRMGYISLACPVTHIWYLRRRPSCMSQLLAKPLTEVESLVYGDAFLAKPMAAKPALLRFKGFSGYSEEPWREALECFLSWGGFGSLQRREMTSGGDAIQKQLAALNLEALLDRDRHEWEELGSTGLNHIRSEDQEIQRRRDILLRRIRLVQELLRTKVKPEWMVLSSLPVLPPDLRPLTEREDGELATSDLNELYGKVIYRNNLLLEYIALGESSIDAWAALQKKQLQYAVDHLLDNGKGGRPLRDRHDRRYKSLSDVIQGKEGRFRENLLGKRVDYSGRSVIVVGPSLALYQCGLPEEMARELFQPFVVRALMIRQLAPNYKTAKRMIQKAHPIVRAVLREVVQDHPVLLNRAPTLHRLGIQSFQPVLTRERAIRLHPLVCTGFNADFDGDQMAVHMPISLPAQAEARMLMCSEMSILSPATGDAVAVPSQDMLLGLYVLTLGRQGGVYSSRGEPSHFANTGVPSIPMFASSDEVLATQAEHRLSPHSSLWLRIHLQSLALNTNGLQNPLEAQYEPQGSKLYIYKHWQIRISREEHTLSMYLLTTLGRVIFNQQIKEVTQKVPQISSSFHTLSFDMKPSKKVPRHLYKPV